MASLKMIAGALALTVLTTAATTAIAGKDVTFRLAATQSNNLSPQYPSPGGQGLNAYNYTVEVADKTCTIGYAQTQCTISNLNTGKRLVSVYWHGGTGASEANIIHRVSFWTALHPYQNSTVNIPSSNVTFKMATGQNPGGNYVEFYVRSGNQVILHDQFSQLGTKNASNTGLNILNLTSGGVEKVVPMLAGCYSVGTLRSSQSSIQSVHHSVITAEADRALCVGGLDNDITVTFDSYLNQISAID